MNDQNAIGELIQIAKSKSLSSDIGNHLFVQEAPLIT